MDCISVLPIDQKARCLAIHRVKAKMIKDSFISEGCIDREEFVGKQVIKYSTLLSEKMLHKIKTEELKEFQKDVQEYCRETQKNIEFRKSKRTDFKQLNLSQYLSNFKDSTKVRLLQTNKKRTKTSQSYQLAIKPGRVISPDPQPEGKMESPLGNQKIKEAIQHNKKKVPPANRFQVSGKGVNSQIVQLLEKLDEIESIEKLRKRRECLNEEEEIYLHGKTNILKQEKQRLSTAFQNQQRAKFKPMGRIKKQPKGGYDKNQIKIQELDYLKKLHHRGNRLTLLQPLKKPSASTSSNCVSQASIHLQQGLPKSIRNHIPNKKLKMSQAYIINQESRQEGSFQNVTPPLLHSNHIFISNNFV